MATTARISGPVGRAAMNHPKDVFTVQQLLNGHMQRDPCRKLLREDGRWSRALERSIATFQQLSGSPVMTQGRIAPATRMFELLAQPPAIFGYERRMAQFMGPEPMIEEPTIEVFIYDALLTRPGSQWGHAAIDIDGKTYSQAPTRYAVLEREQYLSSNLATVKRDVTGLVLRVSREEKTKIKAELEKRVAAQNRTALPKIVAQPMLQRYWSQLGFWHTTRGFKCRHLLRAWFHQRSY